jgi:uncharacterized protein (DUF983 family)
MFGAAGARQFTVSSVNATQIEKGQPTIVRAALFGLCPQCGTKSMFASATQFSDKCPACTLDYQQFNVGDGPAALLIIPIGAIIIGLAILLDIAIRPPFWVHVIIWVPVTAVLVIGFLRAAKGAMLALEFRNHAGEAKQVTAGDELP